MSKSLRILLTGQSGIGSEQIISNLLTHYETLQNDPPKYIKLETYISSIYKKYLTDRGLTPNSVNIWSDLLIEPIPFLYEWWKEACLQIVTEVNANPDANYIINLHACWYHHDTVEYLSLINFQLLSSLAPTVVVTFIDDIYDMQLRLRQKGQFLNSKLFDRPSEMIKTAMQILDWRSKEILLSRHIAMELKIPHFLFAIKHEQNTLYDLLFSDKKRVYLSHPISEVRRLEKDLKLEKAQKIKNEIAEISKLLSSLYVPLLPTTIDELRLRKSQVTDGFTYGLTPRWETEKYQGRNHSLLFIPPDNSAGKEYFGDFTLNDTQEVLFQELLIAFYDRIAKQVSARDKKMVEQCEVLFVYRPCFNGNMSSGVLAEINYYHKLLEGRPTEKKCIIYCPLKDQNDLKITAIENEIKLFFELKKFKFTEEEKVELLKTYGDEAALAERLTNFLETHDLDVSKKWEVLDMEVAREAKETILKFIRNSKNVFDIWINEHYKAQTSDGMFFEEDDLTPAQIMANIKKIK